MVEEASRRVLEARGVESEARSVDNNRGDLPYPRIVATKPHPHQDARRQPVAELPKGRATNPRTRLQAPLDKPRFRGSQTCTRRMLPPLDGLERVLRTGQHAARAVVEPGLTRDLHDRRVS